MTPAPHTALVVVDLQTKLLAALPRAAAVLARTALLLDAAHAFGLPVAATEHAPERIGLLDPAIRPRIPDQHIITKTCFSAAAEPGALARFQALQRSHLVVVGAEAHVCVLQTALGLADAGWQVTLVADAVASRREQDRACALTYAATQGLSVVTTEMLVFAWLGHAGHPAFRPLIRAIKALA